MGDSPRDFFDYEPGAHWGQFTRDGPEPSPEVYGAFPVHENAAGEWDEWLGFRAGGKGGTDLVPWLQGRMVHRGPRDKGRFVASAASRWGGWNEDTHAIATSTHVHRRELDDFVQVNFSVATPDGGGRDLWPASWLFTYERAGEWLASDREYLTTKWALITASPAVVFADL